jgi:hypothetical protein
MMTKRFKVGDHVTWNSEAGGAGSADLYPLLDLLGIAFDADLRMTLPIYPPIVWLGFKVSNGFWKIIC